MLCFTYFKMCNLNQLPVFGPLPRAKFHVYRGNVSPLRGEKPIFGPLSKKQYRHACATRRPASNNIHLYSPKW